MKQIAFGDASVPTSTRIAAISGIVRDAMEKTLATNDDETICDATKTLSNVTANMICRDDFTLRDILPVLHHDYGTFYSFNKRFVLRRRSCGCFGICA